MNNCLFCKIIEGKEPSLQIGESENFVAFLSLGQITKGHSLIIPKKHFEDMHDFPEELAKEWMTFMKKMMQKIKKGTQADALNVGSNNGKESGQVIFHQHTHIIPRKKGDGLRGWDDDFKQHHELKEVYEQIMNA